MPVPLALITRLFLLISERKITEAERVLERITGSMKETEDNEFNKGYLQALKGIILTHRSDNDSDCFFSNLNLNDTDALKRYYKEFLKNAKSSLHADYDRGFFSALADYLRVVLKVAQNKPETDKMR